MNEETTEILLISACFCHPFVTLDVVRYEHKKQSESEGTIMMKKNSLLVLIISMMMAVVMAVMPPAQVAAALGDNSVLYIEDVKIGVGVTADEAASALDGYTILANEGKNVDLNQGAGGGIGSKGNAVRFLRAGSREGRGRRHRALSARRFTLGRTAGRARIRHAQRSDHDRRNGR